MQHFKQRKMLKMHCKNSKQKIENLEKKHINKRLQMNRLDMKNLWLRRLSNSQSLKKISKRLEKEERLLKNL